jgi:SAM-dependent methyltransferase
MNNIYKEYKIGRLYAEDRMLEAYGTGSPEATVSHLDQLLKDFEVGRECTVLEIGSYAGVTSELFALRCKKVFCIDPWDVQFERDDPTPNQAPESGGKFSEEKLENELTWEENVKKAERVFDGRMSQYDNFVKIKNFSHEAAGLIEDDSIDFVYLDGDHQYEPVKSEIEAWYPKVRVGGILAGHDYVERSHIEEFGVIPAVNEFIKREKLTDYSVYSDIRGNIIKLITDDKKIEAYIKTVGNF